MPPCELLTPASVPELVAALGCATPASELLAGGTDLVRAMRLGHCRPDLIVDLSGVRELAGVRAEAGHLRIGAMTTFAQLQADLLVWQHAACLAEAASQVGSVQIRNVATVGGNIGNASPCGDSIPALMALGATLTILDGTGRSVSRPIGDVVIGDGETSLAADEVITEIVVPTLSARPASAFAKVGSRSMVTVAKLSMALIVGLNAEAGTVAEARVALGALGDTAFRDARLEDCLRGRLADEATARDFVGECELATRRAIPGRLSLAYKQRAVRGLAYDAWNALGLCPPCQPD